MINYIFYGTNTLDTYIHDESRICTSLQLVSHLFQWTQILIIALFASGQNSTRLLVATILQSGKHNVFKESLLTLVSWFIVHLILNKFIN